MNILNFVEKIGNLGANGIGVIMAVSYGFIYHFIFDARTIGFTCFAFLLIYLATYALERRVKTRDGDRKRVTMLFNEIFIYITLCWFFLSCLYSGGIFSPIIIWCGMFPSYAFYTLENKYKSFLILILSVSCVVSYPVLNMLSILPENELTDSTKPVAMIMAAMGFTLFVATFTLFFKVKIEEQMKHVNRLSEDKGKLIAVLTHDIANPLCIIMMKLGLLKKVLNSPNSAIEVESISSLKEKFLKDIDTMSRNSGRIKAIIDGVKENEAIVMGKKKVKLESISLSEIETQINDVFGEKIKEKGLNIRYTGEFDEFVFAEKNSIFNSVIFNIVSNSIKFTFENGFIEIAVRSAGDRVQLSIRDNGRGMPSEKVEKLFLSNESTSTRGTKGEVGTGFGMPILKAYMDKYGGHVRVESIEHPAKNQGTTFYLVFKKSVAPQDHLRDIGRLAS